MMDKRDRAVDARPVQIVRDYSSPVCTAPPFDYQVALAQEEYEAIVFGFRTRGAADAFASETAALLARHGVPAKLLQPGEGPKFDD
jgi:hypothetical protein